MSVESEVNRGSTFSVKLPVTVVKHETDTTEDVSYTVSENTQIKLQLQTHQKYMNLCDMSQYGVEKKMST